MLLYDLSKDVSESNDVASAHADIVQQVVAMMEEAHVEDKYWKSSYNATDRCCASCFSHQGRYQGRYKVGARYNTNPIGRVGTRHKVQGTRYHDNGE